MNALIIKIIIVSIITAMLGGGAYYVVGVIKENAILEAQNQGYEDSITGYKVAIGSVMEGYTKNEDEKSKLENTLAKHDLGLLAKRKPKMVARIINTGTASMFKSIEVASRHRLPTPTNADTH